MKLEQQIATDMREVLGSKEAERRVQGLLDAERQRVRGAGRRVLGMELGGRQAGQVLSAGLLVASAARRRRRVGYGRFMAMLALQVRALQEEVVKLKCSVAEGNAEEARSALLQLQRENTEQQRRIKELTAQKVCQVQGDAVPVLGPRKWG